MKRLLPTVVVLSVAWLVLPTTAHAQVGFGRAAAVADGEVFIGEPGNRIAPGYVYVYRLEDGDWVEAAALTAPDAADGDGFGTAVMVDGDLLLVGAANDERGRVYLFRRADDGNWQPQATLESGADRPDAFGSALAMGKDLLLVGAPGAAEGWGAVYVYRRSGGDWIREAVLEGVRPAPAAPAQGDDAAAGQGAQEARQAGDEEAAAQEPAEPTPERFGAALAIAGDLVLVGAPGADQRTGAVYAFRAGEGGWQQSARQADGADEGWRLGSRIVVHGDEVYVGAPGAENARGAVRVYGVDAEAGELRPGGTLSPFDGGRFTRFGASLAVDGDDLLVGAPGAGSVGVIYRFERGGAGSWEGVTKIGAAGLTRGASFGGELALRGDVLVATLPGDDFGAGTAVIMTRAAGGWDRTRVLSDVKTLPPMTGRRFECADGRVGPFPCENVDLLAYLPIPAIGGGRGVMINDIWGWVDPDTGREYAIVGMSNATSFVDVTDPSNPVYVGKLPKTPGARASVWRDIKVYGDHAFIVSDAAGRHGMQVFDLRNLRAFDGRPRVFREDAHYDGIYSAHNIVINEESAFAYIVGASGGGETCGGGLHMVNIEDPRQPVFAGCFQDTRTGRRGTGYSHDAQCVLYEGPDERYRGHEICFGSNETALSVADVTDKRNPKAIGMSSYPNVAYTHQGWLSADQRYFFMNDEGDEAAGLVPGTRTIIWDVQDLEDPIVVGEYVSDNPAIDHNLYVDGRVMYESNYDSGLRVFDVSNPEQIRPIGYLDTVPYGKDGEGFGGSWSNYPYFRDDVVVVTSMNEGLFVVQLRKEALTAGATDDGAGE